MRGVDELPGPRVALVAGEGGPLARSQEPDGTLVVGAEREGLADDVVAACDEVAPHPDRVGVAERGDGRDGGPIRAMDCTMQSTGSSRSRTRARARSGRAPRAPADELEELRVEHLGRKAELPNLLRGVAQLPPEERGEVGKAPTRRAGRSRR